MAPSSDRNLEKAHYGIRCTFWKNTYCMKGKSMEHGLIYRAWKNVVLSEKMCVWVREKQPRVLEPKVCVWAWYVYSMCKTNVYVYKVSKNGTWACLYECHNRLNSSNNCLLTVFVLCLPFCMMKFKSVVASCDKLFLPQTKPVIPKLGRAQSNCRAGVRPGTNEWMKIQ